MIRHISRNCRFIKMYSEKIGFVVGVFSETPEFITTLVELQGSGFHAQDTGILGSANAMPQYALNIQKPDSVEEEFKTLFTDPMPLQDIESKVALVGSRQACLSMLGEFEGAGNTSKRPSIVHELKTVCMQLASSLGDNDLIFIVTVNDVSQLVAATKVLLHHSTQSVQTHLLGM